MSNLGYNCPAKAIIEEAIRLLEAQGADSSLHRNSREGTPRAPRQTYRSRYEQRDTEDTSYQARRRMMGLG